MRELKRGEVDHGMKVMVLEGTKELVGTVTYMYLEHDNDDLGFDIDTNNFTFGDHQWHNGARVYLVEEAKTSGLGAQVGGDHYTGMKLQPLELTYRLGQTPAFCKVSKYCTRVKDNTLQQLQKAKHCITIEMELTKHLKHYQRVGIKEANNFICEFTEDKSLRNVLLSMHTECYENALWYLEEMIEQEKLNGQR